MRKLLFVLIFLVVALVPEIQNLRGCVTGERAGQRERCRSSKTHLMEKEILEKVDASLDKWANGTDIAKNILASIAIIVGGCWTWRIYVQHRQKYPKAALTHNMSHIKDVDGKTLLRVALAVSNIGNVKIEIKSGFVRVQQVLPLKDEIRIAIQDQKDQSDDEVGWALVEEKKYSHKDDFEVEPGESEELHFDFFIPQETDVVIVNSHLTNVSKKKKQIGWDITDMYEISIPRRI